MDKEKEVKAEEKEKSNEKCLYKCESEVNSYEYKRMVNYFPIFYWSYVYWGIILNLVLTAIVAIIWRKLIIALIFFVVEQLYLMILYKVRLEHYAEKSFNKAQKQGKRDTQYNLEFYDKYFIRQGEIETLKINYNDISQCVETETNLYLKFDRQNKIIIIQKNKCDSSLINFLIEKFKKLDVFYSEEEKNNSIKKKQNANMIKIILVVLFVMTILSYFGAMYIDGITNSNPFDSNQNNWIAWCWLPIPITSIILGFKYKKFGYKCIKNIVAGFIVSIVLLIFGLFSLAPSLVQNYSRIYEYKNYISADLPANGELFFWDAKIYNDADKTNYTVMNVFYRNEDFSNLTNSIINNSNWIPSKEIPSQLKIFIHPDLIVSEDNIYFSIYNKTTNQYNTIPESSGDYEIYVMRYDVLFGSLTIHKFNYSFK